MNYARPPFESNAAVSCYNPFLNRSALDRSSPITRKQNSMSPHDYQYRNSSKFDADDDEVLKFMKGSQSDAGLMDGSPTIPFNSAFMPSNRDVFHSTPTSVSIPVNLNSMQQFAANLLTSPTHQPFPFHAAFNPSASPPSKGVPGFHNPATIMNASPNSFSSLSGMNCASPSNADHMFVPYADSNQRIVSRPFLPLSPCPALENCLSSVELEFPSLDSRHQRNSTSNHGSTLMPANLGIGCSPSNSSKNNFAVAAKLQLPQDNQAGFEMQLEDFPLLPRNQSSPQPSSNSTNQSLTFKKSQGEKSSSNIGTHAGTIASNSVSHSTSSTQAVDYDPYGMAGLKKFLQESGNHENAQYTINTDLTTLGLNINGMESLFPTFLSPFSEYAARPHEIECAVPHEYLVFSVIKERLSSIQLDLYQDDLLFFLFYNFCGDILQLLAALELFNRDWRFHKEEKVWICRIPGNEPSNKTQTHECGTYYVFDVMSWRKVTRDMRIDYDKLDEKSILPANYERTKATLEGKRRRTIDSW